MFTIRLGYTTREVTEKTIKTTTQLGIMYKQLPLKGHYKSPNHQYRHPWLRFTVYMDTMFANTKSISGRKCVQVFVDGDAEGLAFYPMKEESQSPIMLNNFAYNFGIPAQIHSDHSRKETLSKE